MRAEIAKQLSDSARIMRPLLRAYSEIRHAAEAGDSSVVLKEELNWEVVEILYRDGYEVKTAPTWTEIEWK